MLAVAEPRSSTTLSATAVADFHAKGYHIHERLFSADEIEALRAHADRVTHGFFENDQPPDGHNGTHRQDSRKVIKIDNCWKADRTMATAAFSPKIGHIAAQLIGAGQIRIWHDQFLHKPARGGRVVTWHQDWAYWQCIAECQTVTCWIALDDVHPDSGPMDYLEGSHKLGLFPLPKIISGDDEQFPILPPDLNLRKVPVLVKAGQVAFHHGLTLHGSGKNTGATPRRALVSHVMSGACTYKPGQPHHNEHWMKKYEVHPQPGERFHGPQFPIIWDAQVMGDL